MSGLRDWVRDCIVNCKTSGKLNPANAAEVLTEILAEHLDEEGGGGSGLPSGGAPYQQLVTDGEGVAKWEDRLAYSNELLCVPISDTAGYYKVSAKIPDIPNAADGVSANVWLNGAMVSAEIAWKTEESYMVSDYVAVALKDNASLDVGGYLTLSLPEKGTYFVKMGDTYTAGIAPAGATAPEIEWDGQTGVVKPIDPKYLPEGVGVLPVFVVDVDMETLKASHTAVEIGNAIKNGYKAVLRMRDMMTEEWLYGVKLMSRESGVISFLVWGLGDAINLECNLVKVDANADVTMDFVFIPYETLA